MQVAVALDGPRQRLLVVHDVVVELLGRRATAQHAQGGRLLGMLSCAWKRHLATLKLLLVYVIARHDYTKSGAAEALRAEAQNTRMEQIKVPFGRL